MSGLRAELGGSAFDMLLENRTQSKIDGWAEQFGDD